MTIDARVFLVRGVTLAPISADFCRIDFEHMFLDHGRAAAFLGQKFNQSKMDSEIYRYEMVELFRESGNYRKETYGTTGALLATEELLDGEFIEQFVRGPAPAPHGVGDVCALFKNIEHPRSAFVVNQVGVFDFDEEGEELFCFLNSEGYWGHTHSVGHLVKKVVVPDEYHLFRVLSGAIENLRRFKETSESFKKFVWGDIPWYLVSEFDSVLVDEKNDKGPGST